MNFVEEILAGSETHRATLNLGGAVLSPINDSDDATSRFQFQAQRILANDGLGYDVVHRLTRQSSDHRDSPIERIVINLHR